MSKRLFSYEEVHESIREASAAIADWRPTLILAIGGGGYIPARVLRTFVKPHCPGLRMQAIGLSLYEHDVDACAPGTRVVKTQWLSYGDGGEEGSLSLSGQRILIVDEVDDTRRSLAYAVAELAKDAAAERARWQQRQRQRAALAGGGSRVASPATPGVLTPAAGSPSPDSPMMADDGGDALAAADAGSAAAAAEWVEPQFAVFVVHDKQKPKSARLPGAVEYFCGASVPGDAWIVYPWDAYDAHEHAEAAKASAAAAAAVC